MLLINYAKNVTFAQNKPTPQYTTAFGGLMITFASAEKSTEKSAEKIFKLIQDNATITTQELAQTIGITTSAIEKNIKKLKQEGRLERIGSDRSGYWKTSK
jgi:predicted HTH transcriptional regulator